MELVDSGLRILGLTLSLKPEALNPDPITLNPKPYNPKSLRFWGFCDFLSPLMEDPELIRRMLGFGFRGLGFRVA